MSIVNITKQGLKCERCSHEWIPNKEQPIVCPKCKSPYYNIPKKVSSENGRE